MNDRASNEVPATARSWSAILPASNDRLLLCLWLLGAVAVTVVLINGNPAVFPPNGPPKVTYVRQVWRVENAAAPGVQLGRGSTVHVGDVIQVTVNLYDLDTGEKAAEAMTNIAIDAPEVDEDALKLPMLEFLDASPPHPTGTNDPNRPPSTRGGKLGPSQRFRAAMPGRISMVASPPGSMLPKGAAEDGFFWLTVVP